MMPIVDFAQRVATGRSRWLYRWLRLKILGDRRYGDNIEEFWNSCPEHYAHISNRTGERERSDETLSLFGVELDFNSFKDYAALFQLKYNMPDMLDFFRGRSVAEYGIGSGLLGKLLFQYCSIQEYVGIDIAERQLKAAEKVLGTDGSIRLLLAPVNLADFGANVFISHACIQHFPSREYYEGFLKNLNRSHISSLLLQTRYSSTLSFNFDDSHEACRTHPGDMEERLSNYSLIFASDPDATKSAYQYTRWQTSRPDHSHKGADIE